MRLWLIPTFVILQPFVAITSFAQDSTKVVDSAAVADSLVAGALNIIVDCSTCDQNYFKTEITFVNFVRVRALADVDILITRQTTGALGTEFTLEFIGQRDYTGMRDTLKFVSQQADTDDTKREGLVRTIKLGLMRFVSRTPLSPDIKISYDKPAVSNSVKDPWNYWVFSLSANGWANGQKSSRQFYVNSQFSARRTTEMLKVRFLAYQNYNENKYDYSDYKSTSISRSRGVAGSVYFGLDNHWSAGFSSEVSGSTYDNTKIEVYGSAGVEYNIFPYKESTRRQFRLQYRVGGAYDEFRERTIYDQLHAWLGNESISAQLSLIRPWGSVSGGVWGSHYFHDFDKNRLSVQSNVSLRIISGLSLNCDGYIAWIHDQIALPAGDATQEEVLLQRRQLATSYEYWVSFGFSYTFGSIYNTIVNPRFGN